MEIIGKRTLITYNTPWKKIIGKYFTEFIAFFFPQAYQDIDWAEGYEFLDKEFQQISKDAEIGRKYVDKLALPAV